MSKYEVIVSKKALKFLGMKKKNNKSLYDRIRLKIDEIKKDPTPFDELVGHKPYKKARVGSYRIIFYIFEENVCIVDINHRKKIYKRI